MSEDLNRPTNITLKQFQRLIDKALSERGYPVSIHDLPDIDFYDYYWQEMTTEEARDAAHAVIDDLIDNGELPDLAEFAEEGSDE